MATLRLAFGALAAFPVFAQFQSTVVGKPSAAAMAIPGEPRFELYADISAAKSKIVAGYGRERQSCAGIAGYDRSRERAIYTLRITRFSVGTDGARSEGYILIGSVSPRELAPDKGK